MDASDDTAPIVLDRNTARDACSVKQASDAIPVVQNVQAPSSEMHKIPLHSLKTLSASMLRVSVAMASCLPGDQLDSRW